MANVTGQNIMLYNTTYNAKYYLNGNISSNTIGGFGYKQLGNTNNAGSTLVVSKIGDGLVAGFITDIGFLISNYLLNYLSYFSIFIDNLFR